MQSDVSQNLFKSRAQKHVLYNERVDAHTVKRYRVLEKIVQFVFFYQRIHRRIDLYAETVRVIKAVFQFFPREVFRARSRRETLKPEIHGVGAVIYSRQKMLFPARGRQNFAHLRLKISPGYNLNGVLTKSRC